MNKVFITIFLSLLASFNVFAQIIVQTDETLIDNYSAEEVLGFKLRPEVLAIIKEIKRKSGEEVYTEFTQLKMFQLGASFITDEGVPVVRLDYRLEKGDRQKLEAVYVHELLHLRLRVNNFPTFLFSPTVNTAKGRAIDVEQSTVNDLLSIIEHRAFKPEMERLGLQKHIDLAGDVAKSAKGKKRGADGQDDSINYARAILEYPNQIDVDEVAKIFRENKWTRALTSGKRIADFISQANLQTPSAVEAVFLKCITELYQPPATHTFKFTLDPENKIFRRMMIGTARKTVRRKSR